MMSPQLAMSMWLFITAADDLHGALSESVIDFGAIAWIVGRYAMIVVILFWGGFYGD